MSRDYSTILHRVPTPKLLIRKALKSISGELWERRGDSWDLPSCNWALDKQQGHQLKVDHVCEAWQGKNGATQPTNQNRFHNLVAPYKAL